MFFILLGLLIGLLPYNFAISLLGVLFLTSGVETFTTSNFLFSSSLGFSSIFTFLVTVGCIFTFVMFECFVTLLTYPLLCPTGGKS